jgi:hypothetical protein
MGRGCYTPYTGYYTADEWQSLSSAQRTRVTDAPQSGNDQNRRIGTLDASATPDDTSAITTPTQLQGTIITTPSGGNQSQKTNAGNQFGQRAHFIGAVHSGARKSSLEKALNISSINSEQVDTSSISGRLELDTQADTTCVGSDWHVIVYTEKVYQVTPYHPGYEPIIDVPIVQAALAYMDTETGKIYILIINETLYMGDSMECTYLNPNHMRHHGVIVDDIPRHLSPNPSTASHSIYVPASDLRIPLQIDGVISYIPTHYPTTHEIETCEWVELTSSEPWD